MKVFWMMIACLSVLPAAAQNQQVRPCDTPEGKQMDFWVGDWDLTWTDAQGNSQQGHNLIRKVLGSCIVEENFDGGTFKGRSYSVYNPNTKLWQQTWVDNNGGYIALTGGQEGDTFILATAPRKTPKGQDLVTRMVFKNISEQSFDWHWQRSLDGGKTWQDSWVIHYKRKGEG